MPKVSAAEQRALRLAADAPVTKYDVPYCDTRTAQRALKRLHLQGKVFIAAWVPVYKQKIPAYQVGPGKDKPKPAPLTSAARARRRRRTDPEFCMMEAAKKRAVRFLQKQLTCNQQS